MRKKLIELLDDALLSVDWNSSDYPDTDQAADILIANGVTIQRWIPVTERLPGKDQNVWCYSNKRGGHFFMGHRGISQ